MPFGRRLQRFHNLFHSLMELRLVGIDLFDFGNDLLND
jgi:hypothetical protein